MSDHSNDLNLRRLKENLQAKNQEVVGKKAEIHQLEEDNARAKLLISTNEKKIRADEELVKRLEAAHKGELDKIEHMQQTLRAELQKPVDPKAPRIPLNL